MVACVHACICVRVFTCVRAFVFMRTCVRVCKGECACVPVCVATDIKCQTKERLISPRMKGSVFILGPM